MRRFLILLAVLAGGAGLLWHFEQERRDQYSRDGELAMAETSSDDELAERGAGQDSTEPAVPTDAGDPPGEDEDAGVKFGDLDVHDGESAFQLGGSTFTRKPTKVGEPRIEIVIEDRRPIDKVGLAYELFGLSIDSYAMPTTRNEAGELVPDTTATEGELTSSIDAKSAFAKVLKPGIGSFLFSQNLEAELFDVVVEQKRGSPFAPVTLEAGRLKADLGKEEFHSVDDQLVKFRSRDVTGSGVGFDANMKAGSVAFERGAEMRFMLDDGMVLDASTPSGGPLSIRDVTPTEPAVDGADPASPARSEGPRDVQVLMSEGVHAELRMRESFVPDEDGEDSDDATNDAGEEDPEGEPKRTRSAVLEPLIIDAESLDIELTTGSGDQPPIIRSAKARGAVVIRHGRDVYMGETARVYFKDGEPARVVIEEEPTMTYVLREADGREVTLKMAGKGPITGFLDGDEDDPELRFSFKGPGRVEALGRGGVVTFDNEVRGSGQRDRSEAVLIVSGDVRVETPAGAMTSESVLATYRAGTDLRVATEGSTLVIGQDPDSGDEYHVRAEKGLSAHLVEDAWFVDRAEGVYAESFGDEPHRVRAGIVTNVDLAAMTLTADDTILYESLWGRAYAREALVRTADSVWLKGSIEDPVKLDLLVADAALLDEAGDPMAVRSGWIHATQLRLDSTEVIASGGVFAQVETFDGVWGFDADDLSLRRDVIGESFVADGGAAEPAIGAFRAEKLEELYIAARFVREARYDTDEGNFVVTADQLDVVAAVAAKGDDGRTAIIDPDRPALLNAAGRVTLAMESYGPDVNEQGLPTVQQTWNLASESMSFERGPRGVDLDAKVPFRVEAQQVTEYRMAGGSRVVELTADGIVIVGEFGAADSAKLKDKDAEFEELDLSGSSITAKGNVDLRYKASADVPAMRGRCDSLVLLDGERGRMEAEVGKRVRAWGVIPAKDLPYSAEANLITFTKDELTAESTVGAQVIVKLEKKIALGFKAGFDEIRATSLTATKDYVELVGSVENPVTLTGPAEKNGVAPILSSDKIRLDPADIKFMEEPSPQTISPFEPVPRVQEDDEDEDDEGGGTSFGEFDLKYTDGRISASDSKVLSPGVLQLKTASMEVLSQGISLDAEELTVDIQKYMISAQRGAIRGEGETPWTLRFAGIESVEVGDEIMFVVTAPRLEFGGDSARADYLSIWVDRAKWVRKGAEVAGVDPPADLPVSTSDVEAPEHRPNFLAELLFELQEKEYSGYLRALYMEGAVEVAREDRRAARGSRLYIDLPKAVAWLEDAELVYPLMSKGQEVPLRVRTERLGTDDEGRLTAEQATLTTCDHDVPHFVVLTRLFKLEPRPDGRWRFGARGNKLKFDGGWSLPLPSIGNLVLDEEFGIEGFENEAGEVTPLRDIGIARTARFGTVLGAAFRFDIGDVGSWLAKRIGMDSSQLRGKWETEAQYLGSRGPLLGLGLQLRERKPGDDPDEDFRLDAFVGGIVDDGEDRGTVRVPESERDDLRVRGYVRARYPIVRGEWFDFAAASQTDGGVQAEFYENDFQRFEQRDTFVRWRKALGADYLAAGAQKRIEDFRSQKEELPSFGAYRGEREIGRFTGLPILWGGSFDAGYFTRREGIVGRDLFSDLPGGAAIGLGNRETGRADLSTRVSMPVQTSFAAIKATPFANLRGTAWTDALDNGDDPRRGAVNAGLELSTTLHKVTGNGYLHALAPRISYSTDVLSETRGGSLIPLDQTEEPIDGDRIEAGLRSLWQRPATFENLDVDLRAILRQDRDLGIPDSREFGILAEYITRYGDGTGQVGVRHDARYDIDNSETTYSRSALAIRPNDAFLVEFRYSQARAIDNSELYETGGLLGRWRVDPKWELETRYVHDLKNDQQLLTELTVRRYAHDFIFDITFQDRSGEGGTNLSFSLSPLLGWAASRLGMLDR